MHPLAPILLVEDNRDDEALTLRALAKNGVGNPVVVTRDGVQALQVLFDEPAADAGRLKLLPALVLLDLKLPRLDGIEVLRRLRGDRVGRGIPVVVLTTSVEPQDIRHAYTLGASSYVRKPVDFEEFIRSVGQLVAYWLELDEMSSRSDALSATAGG